MASGQGDTPAGLTGRLALLIRRAGNRLFQAEDARARQYSWQITARRGGLARTYRDPRFDLLCSCAACGSTGTGPSGQSCGQCDGTGPTTLTQRWLTDRGRSS